MLPYKIKPLDPNKVKVGDRVLVTSFGWMVALVGKDPHRTVEKVGGKWIHLSGGIRVSRAGFDFEKHWFELAKFA